MEISKSVKYSICCTQAKIFRKAATNGYNMQIFTECYMKSDFCRQYMDTLYSRFQVADEEECLDFIIMECKEKLQKNRNNIIFNPDVAEWIGYEYRDIYLEKGILSKDLIDKIPFQKVCNYYPGMHTIEERNAVDIIVNNVR